MKNIDPNKVSNFKNHQPSYHQHSILLYENEAK
jgi:hypothetical protein